MRSKADPISESESQIKNEEQYLRCERVKFDNARVSVSGI